MLVIMAAMAVAAYKYGVKNGKAYSQTQEKEED